MSITKKLEIKNMHCSNCERIIAKTVKKIEGVKDIHVSYASEKAEITFDPDKTNLNHISEAIEQEGYTCSVIEHKREVEKDSDHIAIKKDSDYISIDKKTMGWIFGIIGIITAGYFILKLTNGIAVPEISQNMGYGLLFLGGILTGLHCIAMCGGFVVSYTAKDAQEGRKSYKSHLMYGIGKTASYTFIGAAFGLLGSIIIFTPLMRGVAGIIAGSFLIIFGINMLGFNLLRGLRMKTPASIEKFVGKESKKHRSPLVIGLLNGLMIACGPLQAIYIMAAGTGSMIEGAKLLFIFGLGTLPVMLSFGFLATIISNKATHKILKASGIIVILLGLIMVNRGLALTGSGFSLDSITQSNSGANSANNVVISGGVQEVNMDVGAGGYSPKSFVLKKGVPVKWNVNVKQLTGCNRELVVGQYNINKQLKQGMNIIEFTPAKTGTVTFTCGMGMLRGSFLVTEDGKATQQQVQAAAPSAGGSCGAGCGCGG